MELSIVISTHNRAKSLAGVLVAIIGQDHDMEQIEVIVSDNGSTDTTLAIAEGFRKAFPNFRYLYDPRPGQIVGWHRALSITKAEVIAFIDDDIRPNPQWANAAIEIFSDLSVGLATGRILPVFNEPTPKWHELFKKPYKQGYWSGLWGSLELGSNIVDIPAGLVWGSNFLARKSAVIEAGGFHPGSMPSNLFHFTGDGDVGLGWEVEKLGYRVRYHPDASVEHHRLGAMNTEREIEYWIFGEGLVSSYSHLRQLASSLSKVPPSDLVRISEEKVTDHQIKQIGQGYFGQGRGGVPDRFMKVFCTAGEKGFRYHREKFKLDHQFREWVLRQSYLDIDNTYRHPELIKVAKINQSTRKDKSADISWLL